MILCKESSQLNLISENSITEIWYSNFSITNNRQGGMSITYNPRQQRNLNSNEYTNNNPIY